MTKQPLARRSEGTPIAWEHSDDAPQTHLHVARILIAAPNTPLESVARLTRMSLKNVQLIVKHQPLIEYIEQKKMENLDTFLAANELFPHISSEAMLVVESIMKDDENLAFARLKAAEILLSRDPHQLFPDKSKLRDLSTDVTAVHSTDALESIQEKGQLMRDRAERKLIDVTPKETPTPEPSEEKPVEADPDEPVS